LESLSFFQKLCLKHEITHPHSAINLMAIWRITQPYTFNLGSFFKYRLGTFYL